MSYICAMFPDNRIRALRKKAGLTQAELGERVGLHQTQIGNLENGSRNLTLEWARRLAKALDARVIDLLDDNDNPDRLTDEERDLLSHYRAADPAQREMVQRVAEPLQSYSHGDDPSDRLLPRKVA